MPAVTLVFAIGWAAFWIYWLAAAVSTTRGPMPWARQLRIRTLIIVLLIVLTSAVVEERTMAEHVPDGYPAYRRSTKMLVPFVF